MEAEVINMIEGQIVSCQDSLFFWKGISIFLFVLLCGAIWMWNRRCKEINTIRRIEWEKREGLFV